MSRSLIRLYSPHLFEREPSNACVPLSSPQAHYLRHVMRVQPGESIRIFNGQQGEWRATVVHLDKQGGTALLEHLLRSQDTEQLFPINLYFAPIKHHRLTFLLEKATELGVTRLFPVITDRTIARSFNIHRAQTLCQEAAEQCERLSLPTLQPSVPLKEVLMHWHKDRPLYVCDERKGGIFFHNFLPLPFWGTNSLPNQPIERSHHPAHPFSFLVGPEGGFSEEEQRIFDKEPWIHPFTLGPLTLRSETAVVSALSLFHSRRI